MGKRRKGVLILAGYCVPFLFLAMLIDFHRGSILSYVAAVVCLPALSFLWRQLELPFFMILIGNALNFLSSYYLCIRQDHTVDRWIGFFKPFSSTEFLIFLTVLTLGVQAMVLYLQHAKKHPPRTR